MADRSEDLRKEAVRCLESAARCADPNSRAELIRLAERFIDLTKSVPSDFAQRARGRRRKKGALRPAVCVR